MTLVRQVDNAIVRSPLLIVLIHFNIDIHIYKFIISIFKKTSRDSCHHENTISYERQTSIKQSRDKHFEIKNMF